MTIAKKASPSPRPDMAPVKRALISVSDKEGVLDFAKALAARGVHILSTGGTARLLKDAGVAVTDVSAHTGFPEIMDGRVKTLHPKIHGGILAVRDDAGHVDAMTENGIGAIDLIAVTLYPFAQTVADGADFDTCIENIDIGGPAMIRAAAKNHAFVTVITDPSDYTAVLADMDAQGGATSLRLRTALAAKAFALTAGYDSMIATWFSGQVSAAAFPERVSFSGRLKQPLRYGENPHQGAALYAVEGLSRPGVTSAQQVQGKELSYNNINDTDAAFELVAEFDRPAVAIIKHANPCGVASADSIAQAYDLAFQCDPVSAFGGIIALNRTLDADSARKIIRTFCEVIIAPAVEAEALELLKTKDKVRVLITGTMPERGQARHIVKCVAGGLLVQDEDTGRVSLPDLKVVSRRAPTNEELEDMLFAFTVAKHVKSNAIVYAKNRATVGIGAGQMSRLDSCRIAARKAMDAAEGIGAKDPLTIGSVVASDAFFPFDDGLIAAAEAGVSAVIQPGGSIRDEDVIKAADERDLAMVFTGMRHFRH